MKKILLIMISFMAIILLSGCGKLEMGSDTSINTDGSEYFSLYRQETCLTFHT